MEENEMDEAVGGILHAHIETSMSDCDGRMGRSWVCEMNDDEAASEFGDLHFKERVLGSLVSWSYDNSVKVTGCERDLPVIEVSYAHEEGGFWGEARFCTDECDFGESSQSDLYAEMMGY